MNNAPYMIREYVFREQCKSCVYLVDMWRNHELCVRCDNRDTHGCFCPKVPKQCEKRCRYYKENKQYEIHNR